MVNEDSNAVQISKYLNFKDIIYSIDSVPQLRLKYKLNYPIH